MTDLELITSLRNDYKNEVERIALDAIGFQIDCVQDALKKQKKQLAETRQQHLQALQARGGDDVSYRGRECDIREIALDLLCSLLRDLVIETEAELMKLLRKEKRMHKKANKAKK